MISLVTCVNKVRKEKQRKFFFDNTVNSLCQYDPSFHLDDYDINESTEDNNTCTSEENDIIEIL